MLKKRIIATIVVKEGIVVQSFQFNRYLPIGKPDIAVEFLNLWGIDEIILVDISATTNKRDPDYAMIKLASKKCHVPLTVGGGIIDIEQIQKLMHSGVDKISINQSALSSFDLLSQAALIYGNQCVVLSIDAIFTPFGYRVYDYKKKAPTDIIPAEFARKGQDAGAGEILINSVDRDGSYIGFDLELINSICSSVTIPVICGGGAKNANDFIKVFSETKVSAASAANFFHFTEHSVNQSKAIIRKRIDIRLETNANYAESSFDEFLRLNKKEDSVLEEMLFFRIEKEII